MTVRQHNLKPAERTSRASLSGGPSRPADPAGQFFAELGYRFRTQVCVTVDTRLAIQALMPKQLPITLHLA